MSNPPVISPPADLRGNNREAVARQRRLQFPREGGAVANGDAFAAEGAGDGGEVRSAEVHGEVGELGRALFQFDQAELRVRKDEDGQREAEVAGEHLQAAAVSTGTFPAGLARTRRQRRSTAPCPMAFGPVAASARSVRPRASTTLRTVSSLGTRSPESAL